MKRFVEEGTDRSQSTLFPEYLEDWIGEDNPVRFVDVFVDGLSFDGVSREAAGRRRKGRGPRREDDEGPDRMEEEPRGRGGMRRYGRIVMLVPLDAKSSPVAGRRRTVAKTRRVIRRSVTRVLLRASARSQLPILAALPRT